MKKWLTIILSFMAIIVLLGLLDFSQRHAVQYKPYNPKTAGLYRLTHPFLLKALSLGNNQTMADYLWIKLILKMGETAAFTHDHPSDPAHHDKHPDKEDDEKHTHTAEECTDENCREHHHGPKLIRTRKDTLEHHYLKESLPDIFDNYLNTITDIDPKFGYPYHTAIVYFMFHFRDYPKTEYWLDRAIRNNPEYYEFHLYKAFYLYRIKPSPDSLIIKHLKNSVEAPKSLRIYHKNLALPLLIAFNQKAHPLVKQIVFLEGLLETVENKQLKENIINQINELKKQLDEKNKTIANKPGAS